MQTLDVKKTLKPCQVEKDLPELAKVCPMSINVSIKKDGWVFEPAALLILMNRQL